MNDAPSQTTVAPVAADARIVFACGAGISCPAAKLDLFPIGQRYVTYWASGRDMQRPKLPDGAGVNCLYACPATVRESGMQVTRAWAPEDNAATTSPGFMVRCRIKRHEGGGT
jgi:hypothetical protein